MSDTPICFGKSWDQNEAECAGGRDPLYTDPQTGTHIRERCEYFSQCGSRTAAMKYSQSSVSTPIIPTHQLLRNVPTKSNGYSSQDVVTQQLTYQLQQAQQQLQQANQQLQVQARSKDSVYMPNAQSMVRPLNMMSMDMGVPQYLSVPEPRIKGKSIWKSLRNEVVRSVMKSMGHTVANFWDHTTIDKEE